ncbi:vacuolar protein sorting-associated protein VTA1, partial [Schistosoma bovis]
STYDSSGLLHAFQKGLSMIQKSPPIKAFLTTLMDKLEELKRSNSNCEEIANETVGIPYVEQYALKLFDAAYQRDINSDFGPATVKLFLSAATLLDVVSGAGEVEKTRKYAKWKAVYISKCLKSGEVPVGGPIANTEAAYTPNISRLTNTNNLCNNETNQPHEVPTTCIPKQPPSPDPSASDNNITTRNWLNVEKNIKCALSASNYQDRETTVKYLKQALTSLGVDI